jgi:hypothetical protein
MQSLAHSVLGLAWHKEGYLIRTEIGHFPMLMFAQTAQSLPQLMARIRNGSGSLQLANVQSNKLPNAMEPLEARGPKITPTQSCVTEMFNLDSVLRGLCHLNPQVNCALSVLMITNQEFANLVAESARHLTAIDLPKARVEINLHNGNVRLPSGFGFEQTFVVDMDTLLPNEQRDQQPVVVEYPILLLCCLHACLRSSMLCNSLDSNPLLDMFEKLDETVYVDSAMVTNLGRRTISRTVSMPAAPPTRGR